MTKKLFIVTSVVHSADSIDGKAIVLDVCNTREEAVNVIRNDIESFVDDAAGIEMIVDFDQWSAYAEDSSYGCEWDISEHDLEIKEELSND